MTLFAAVACIAQLQSPPLPLKQMAIFKDVITRICRVMQILNETLDPFQFTPSQAFPELKSLYKRPRSSHRLRSS